MRYSDVRHFASMWHLTERRITTLCRTGRIEGAKKENGLWLIPENAVKPIDGRSGKSKRITEREIKRALPIGISDYKTLIDHYYYVDKTLLIKDILDARHPVSLFTRPRRFGKTLAMSMLKTFFEATEEDHSAYFTNMKIWTCGERYRQEQGKYPVIFLSFKDIKFRTWEDTLESIRAVIATEYQRHINELLKDGCSERDREYISTILDGSASYVNLTESIKNLSRLLHERYTQQVVIIIDEYDTPIQQGYVLGYYDEVISFMRVLLSGAFKDNEHLAFGFMTGILRVAKESIFSGLNNLKVNSILDDRYSEYFGFTLEEVKKILSDYHCEKKIDEVCDWYDGYQFGDTGIFNPWSVLNYIDDGCKAQAYWQSTGDNSIIRQIVSEADSELADNLQKLMQGETVSSYVDMSVIYPEIKKNPSTIYSFLLAAGYLKVVGTTDIQDGNAVCTVAIPNKEIYSAYEKEILSALSDVISQSDAIQIKQSLVNQDFESLQKYLQKILIQTISSFDYARENFYHGLMLGICTIMNDHYRMTSNRESGNGRYDIGLKPYDKKYPGIIIELKVIKENVPDERIDCEFKTKAEEALSQIEKKQYITEMQMDGIEHFLKIGIAFHKKNVMISHQTV